MRPSSTENGTGCGFTLSEADPVDGLKSMSVTGGFTEVIGMLAAFDLDADSGLDGVFKEGNSEVGGDDGGSKERLVVELWIDGLS